MLSVLSIKKKKTKDNTMYAVIDHLYQASLYDFQMKQVTVLKTETNISQQFNKKKNCV